jgi:cysteine desulfurase family protein (TIGR01976 family)
MDFDIERVRAAFPALKSGVAHFDAPGGSQVPQQVADAVAETLCGGLANRGSVTEGERRADAVVVSARQAMADLLGCSAEGVVFGRSMTQLTYDVSRALAKQWAPGDEVVVTRLDHDANVRPWVQAAHAAEAVVRWAAFDRGTGELPVRAVEELLSDRTKLVAVTGASNLLGTGPDLAPIATAAHAVGALVYVDGVHLTPHAPIDMVAMGADFFACSTYKFFGPHLGVVAAGPALWEQVRPDKLLPSTEAVPERFELGTLPYELLAGTTAAVDFIAGLAPTFGAAGSSAPEGRRSQVLASMAAVVESEETLFTGLVTRLRALPGVTVHGDGARRTPTVFFSVDGRSPREVHEFLASRRVNAPAGSFYALEAARWLELGEAGAVRAGLAPYTNDDDIDRLLAGVGELCR